MNYCYSLLSCLRNVQCPPVNGVLGLGQFIKHMTERNRCKVQYEVEIYLISNYMPLLHGLFNVPFTCIGTSQLPAVNYFWLYNGGPKSSDLIGSQLLYKERIHNCYDARSFCESITPRLEEETVTKYRKKLYHTEI